MPQPAEPDTSVRFPQRMRLRVPQGLPAAVEAAARQRHTSASEWARQTLLRGLEADGLHLLAGGRVEGVRRASTTTSWPASANDNAVRAPLMPPPMMAISNAS